MTELGILAFELAFEALVVSCVIWVAATQAIHLFRITNAVWRARFLLLPVLLPVVLVPSVHLFMRPVLLSSVPAPVEALLELLLNSSPVWPELFLGIGLLLLLLAFVQVLRLLAAAYVLRREWRRQRATPLSLRCDVVLRSLATRMRMSPPRLIVAGRWVPGSFALGPFGSYIVVSRTLASALDDEETEAMLAHESGHIKRNDTALGAAAGMCRCLLAFSPFAQNAYGRHAVAREQAVDDLAVRSGGRPLALASCLVKSFRLIRMERPRVLINALVPSPSALEGRIRRLIEWRTGAEPARSHWCAFFGVVVGVVAVSLLAL